MGDSAYQYETWEEMLNGKVVAMSPRPAVRHNDVAFNIANIFKRCLKGKPCRAFIDGVDVHLTEKDVVIPDVMIVCNRDIIKPDGIYGTPDLIVEVLSFSTAKRDRGYKKNLYEQCGVKEYWLVDTENRFVEVYLLKEGKLEFAEVYTVIPDYALKKMSEEEKSSIVKEFKTSLFSDMIIKLDEVFEDII